MTYQEKIEYLHSNNIILGDINPENILIVSPTEVYFVDCDSYQVEGFPCPVGTINFTPPELQGKRYDTLLRSFGNEYFAVATLLFMLMLPGKPPYSQQGGGSPIENIREMNFSYACGESSNRLQPDGPWRFMWSHLPRKVKEMFYSTFRKGEANSTETTRFTTTQWLNQFREYKKLLSPGGHILENDKMSNWVYPTRLKDHDVTCKNCNSKYRYKDGKFGYCPSCEPRFRQRCKGCGEAFYTNQLRFGYCSECNDEVVKQIVCQNPTCRKTFNFTRGEQLYFQSKGFPEPIRCPECRANKNGSSSRSQNTSTQKTSYTASTTPRPYTPTRPAYTPTTYSNTTTVRNTTSTNTVTTKKKKKWCFITTAVCEYFGKPDNCWELTLLRHFRDHYMRSTVTGRALVEQYYDIAPEIVRALNESEQRDLIYSMLWQHYIRPCLQLIVDEKPEACQRLYQDMVEMLVNNLNGLKISIPSNESENIQLDEEASQQADTDEDGEFDVLQYDAFTIDGDNVIEEQFHNSDPYEQVVPSETDEAIDDSDEHLADLESDDAEDDSYECLSTSESDESIDDSDENITGLESAVGEEDSSEQFTDQDEDEVTEPSDKGMGTSEPDNSPDEEEDEGQEDSGDDDSITLPMLPVVFCVDISRNMDDEAIKKVNCGLRKGVDALSHSDLFNAEICIVAFDSRAEVMCPFSSVDRIILPRIASKGRSMHISEGINLSLDLIEGRVNEYQQNGIPVRTPQLILMTPGRTIGESMHDKNVAIERVNDLLTSDRVHVFPLCTDSLDGENALLGIDTCLYHPASFNWDSFAWKCIEPMKRRGDLMIEEFPLLRL